MANPLKIVRTIADLHTVIKEWRDNGDTIGLVPTMGALHDGHFSLAEKSTAENTRTITTLFVNPKQFGPDEDFSVYPRDEASDAEALAARNVDLLFAPDVAEVYPEGSVTVVSVPGLGDVLEGEFRPGFFNGVATVVSKLLIQSLPDRAYFGEKDYQQLCVIKRMTRDLNIPVEIIGCPIIRESDGLALSSRNAYLSEDERGKAVSLYLGLVNIKTALGNGSAKGSVIENEKKNLLNRGFTSVDYLAVCDAETLKPVQFEPDLDVTAVRILAAAWMGKTRLIDNLSFNAREN